MLSIQLRDSDGDEEGHSKDAEYQGESLARGAPDLQSKPNLAETTSASQHITKYSPMS